VDAVVDLSNVTRDASLGFSYDKAAWSRWERLQSAWIRETGTGAFVLVADDTLRPRLSRADQVRYDQALQSGHLVECPTTETDGTLLARAVADQCAVISRDAFIDHRREPGVTELAVFKWSATRGRVTFRRISMERPLSLVESRRIDKQELLKMGLDSNSPVLDQPWRCTNAGCSADLVVYPNVRKGDPRCPSCDSFLTSDRPWKEPVWVKILVGDEVCVQQLLEDGDEVILGRESSPDVLDVSAFLDGSEQSRISRRHLLLRNEGGHIRAEDLDSTNGTTVASPVVGKRQWLPPARWPAGQSAGVSAGARIRLGGTALRIELSGRRVGRH
jgi:hypothetical protein